MAKTLDGTRSRRAVDQKIGIPQIKPWIECRHRKIHHWLSQAITGHGSFRAYTKRFGKKSREDCMYCGEADTAEHTLFLCSRWEIQRQTAHNAIDWNENDALTPENLIGHMIRNEQNWKILHKMIEKIMMTKNEEERRRQTTERGET